ncbi:MAG: biotin/lipoyl-binding protein, partial [Cyanobacteria bacterium]|nr:biotin/lipoyl-binding protein [Cyanobacteriota bacterium]
MKPIFVIAAICVLIAGVLLTAFLTQPSKEMSLSGLVQAKEIKNASRFGGRVKKVLVKEGDVVHQGEKVLIFDDIELRSKIA